MARSAGGARNDDARSAAFDPAGNLYVAGAFSSISLVLENDTIYNQAPTFAQEDLFVIKYDVSGNYQWSLHGAGNGYDISTSIVSDQEGKIYLAGTSSQQSIVGDTLVNGSSYIVRIDGQGTVEWVKELGQPGDGITTKLKVNSDSNIVAAGHYWSSQISFDAIGYNSYGSSDLFTGVLYKDIITGTRSPNKEFSLNIYPNPGNGKIMIDGTFTSEYHVEVLNINGQKLLQKQFAPCQIQALDISGPAGIYILKVVHSGGIVTQKIVVE